MAVKSYLVIYAAALAPSSFMAAFSVSISALASSRAFYSAAALASSSTF